MSVYQVDEWFVYLDLSDHSAEQISNVSKYLDREGFDHHVDSDLLTVDGFEWKNAAILVEENIQAILNS